MVTNPTCPPGTVSKYCPGGATGDPHARTLVEEAAPLAQLHPPFQSVACSSEHDRRDPHPSSTLCLGRSLPEANPSPRFPDGDPQPLLWGRAFGMGAGP